MSETKETKVILGANEVVRHQARIRLHPSARFDVLGTLTNKRVFAEDNIGTLLFVHYYKDMDRCEVQRSPWGTLVRLVLRNGSDFFFRIMSNANQEDPLETQVWLNNISQILSIMRNQT